jgi:hypothetical protein
MPVRRTYQRVLAIAATVPVVLLSGADVAAHAAVTMPTCNEAASTRLLTTSAPVPLFLWVQQVSPTETRVCFGTDVPELTVVLTGAAGVGVPSVSTTPGTACAAPIVKISDPVAFEFAYAATPVPTLCFAVDGEALTLSFTGASVQALPDVQVYRGANGAIATADCAPHEVAYVFEDTTGIRIIDYSPSPYGPYYFWQECLNNPRRLI